MTSDLDTWSRGDRQRAGAYARDFAPSMIGYVAVLSAALVFGDLDGDSRWRFMWAVAPVAPALFAVRAVLRHLRRVDDYQRQLMLEGLAVGFAASMVAALTVGLLAAGGLRLEAAGWIIYGAGMAGWGCGALLGRR